MSFQITHAKIAVDYTGAGTPSASQILSAANWNQSHFTLSAGSGIAVNSDGASPPNITIALSGSSTSSSGGNIVGNGTNPFLAMFKSQTSVGSSIFQDDGTALKATTDNTSDLGTLALRWRSGYFGTTVSAGEIDAGIGKFGPLNATTATFNSLSIGGTSTLTGTVTAGQINPSADATFPLGTTTLRWTNIFVSATLSAGEVDIGTTKGGTGTFTSLTTNTLTANATSTFNGVATYNANVVPGSDNTYNLGTLNTARWANLYVGTAVSGGTGSFSSIGVGTVNVTTLITNQSQTLLPTTDNLYPLGSLNQRWSSLFVAGSVSAGTGSFSSVGLNSLTTVTATITTVSASSVGTTLFNAGTGSITTFTSTTMSGGTGSFSSVGVGTLNTTTLITNQSQTILPTTDNTYNLGSVPQRWASIFVATNVSGGTGSFSSIGVGTANLTTLNANQATIPTFTTTNVSATSVGTTTFNAGTGSITAFTATTVSGGTASLSSLGVGTINATTIVSNQAQTWLPTTDATYNIGSIAQRWLGGYFSATVSGGAGSFSSATINGSITGYQSAVSGLGTTTPYADNTYDIGTTSLRWRSIYYGTTLSGGNAFLNNFTVNGSFTANGQTFNNLGHMYPLNDNSAFIGSSTLRWSRIITGTVGLILYANSGDTFAQAQYEADRLVFGPGGASAVDTQLKRGGVTNLQLLDDSNNVIYEWTNSQFSAYGTRIVSAGGGFQTNANPIENIGGPAVTTTTSVGGQIDKVRVIVNGVARWIALYDS